MSSNPPTPAAWFAFPRPATGGWGGVYYSKKMNSAADGTQRTEPLLASPFFLFSCFSLLLVDHLKNPFFFSAHRVYEREQGLSFLLVQSVTPGSFFFFSRSPFSRLCFAIHTLIVVVVKEKKRHRLLHYR